MKNRLLSSLALIALFVLASASPAAAQKPIPPIKQTAEFRALKTYVGTLFEKRSTPATPARKSEFRTKLAGKRTAANQKAKRLYTQRVNRISKQDDKKQRRQIKQIRQSQSSQVAALNDSLDGKLATLGSKEDAAISRINGNYASRIDPLVRKRAILRERLNKATNPVKRENLTIKINSVQKQVNVLVNARQSDTNVVVTKYNGRIANVKDLFGTKIARVKASAKSQIARAKLAYKRLFKEQLAEAKAKQTDEIELITDVRDRGAGYIVQMPNV